MQGKARTLTFKDLFTITIEIQSWEYFTISGQLLLARVDMLLAPIPGQEAMF